MKRIISVICLISMALLLCTGCGAKKYAGNPMVGKWAYIHDTETVILELKESGKAKFHGEAYDYELQDGILNLKSSDSEMNLRYEAEGDGFNLWETAVFEYTGEGEPNGLVGTWNNKDTKWSFEFSSEGTFNEDGYFPGYYIVAEDGKSVKLVYNDHFMDTTVYFVIDGRTMTIEYPWPMVPATK